MKIEGPTVAGGRSGRRKASWGAVVTGRGRLGAGSGWGSSVFFQTMKLLLPRIDLWQVKQVVA
jgi:hypothetical protein